MGNNIWKCRHCGQTDINLGISDKGHANHSRWCKQNPKRNTYLQCLQSIRPTRLTMSDEDRLARNAKVAEAWRAGKYNNVKHDWWRGRKHSEETKRKLSNSARQAIENGRIIKAGRCKKFIYKSHLSGEFSVDGTWELKFCEWADKNSLYIQRNGLRFEYIKPNGKVGWYHPDFKIGEFYIEVKGYETELDRCKWKQFKHKLIIINGPALKRLDMFHDIEGLCEFLYEPLSSSG